MSLVPLNEAAFNELLISREKPMIDFRKHHPRALITLISLLAFWTRRALRTRLTRRSSLSSSSPLTSFPWRTWWAVALWSRFSRYSYFCQVLVGFLGEKSLHFLLHHRVQLLQGKAGQRRERGGGREAPSGAFDSRDPGLEVAGPHPQVDAGGRGQRREERGQRGADRPGPPRAAVPAAAGLPEAGLPAAILSCGSSALPQRARTPFSCGSFDFLSSAPHGGN